MIYVVVAPQHAEQLSRSLMRLLRPSWLREDGWTDLYCAVLRHPSNGQAALALPETEQVPIHIEATGEELSAILYAFVAGEVLTEDDVAGVAAAVRAHAGQTVRVVDFIPPSWSQWVLTQEQAEAGGWFPVQPQLP